MAVRLNMAITKRTYDFIKEFLELGRS